MSQSIEPPFPIITTVCFSCRQAEHELCLCSWKTCAGQQIVCVCRCQYKPKKGGESV